MKIALCLSGQPRSFRIAYNYLLKNLLDFYQVDIFIHSWNSEFDEEVKQTYKPIVYKFEKQKFTKEHDEAYGKYFDPVAHIYWPPRNALSGFYSVYECNRLKCEYERDFDFRYDWVIKSRFDYVLNRTFAFHELNSDKLHMPNREKSSPCDQFAIASSSLMNIYCSTYLYIDEYYKEERRWMIGEHLLDSHIRKHNIPLERMDMNSLYKDKPLAQGNILRDDHNYWVENG